MNQIETKFLTFTFETGFDSGDVETHYAVYGKDLYKVINYTKLVKINKRQCRKIFGYTWTEIKKAFKKGEYFLPIEDEDYGEGYGIFFENDHLQLLEDGVYGEFLTIEQ